MAVQGSLCAFCWSRNLLCPIPCLIYTFSVIIPELTMNHVRNIVTGNISVNFKNQRNFVTKDFDDFKCKIGNGIKSSWYVFQAGDIGSEIKLRHGMADGPANILLLLDKKINNHFETLLLLHHMKAKCYEIRF